MKMDFGILGGIRGEEFLYKNSKNFS